MTTAYEEYQQMCAELEHLRKQSSELQASNNHLREAGQALIDRWDTPNWKVAEHTGIFIDALRRAIEATPAERGLNHD